MSEGMADIPEESNVDTESNGVGLGKYENYSDGDRDKEDYSDGDHNKDEDYVETTQVPNQPESKEEQEEVLKAAHKQKKKTSSSLNLQMTKQMTNQSQEIPCGFFHNEITSAHKELPIDGTASASNGAAGRKRKEPLSVSQPGYVNFVRCSKNIYFIFSIQQGCQRQACEDKWTFRPPCRMEKSLAKEHAKTIKGEWIFINSYSIVTCLL